MPSAAVRFPRVFLALVVGISSGCGSHEKEEEESEKTREQSSYRSLTALAGDEQKKVDRAVERGVAFLKAALDENSPGGKEVVDTSLGAVSIRHPGAMALAGLSLLACGVPATDPAVTKVLTHLRTNGREFPDTYTISLTLLFLDLNGGDRRLIQALALRLIAGQGKGGAWGYHCPALSEDDQEDLQTLLKALEKAGTKPLQGQESLRKRFQMVPVIAYQPGQKLKDIPEGAAAEGNEDNSNGQFALLALWAARKYDVPVSRSLGMAEAHFRTTQNEDGSWCYSNKDKAFPASMTCAGLLGLAVASGVNKQGGMRDPQVRKALHYLGATVGKPLLSEPPPNVGIHHSGRLFGSLAEEDLFFLWALERVAVLYDLRHIDGKEWYPWGEKILVGTQNQQDGSWRELYGPVPDTCFALLFLRRANVAQDLTSKLKPLE